MIPLLIGLGACTSTPLTTPLPTAATILEITSAPTQDIDATATTYAQQLIPTPTPAGLYLVQQGDTLSGLAEDFGTTIEELMAANGMTNANDLQSGQTLIIPSLISNTLTFGTATPAPTLAPPTKTLAPDNTNMTPTPTDKVSTLTPTPTLSTP